MLSDKFIRGSEKYAKYGDFISAPMIRKEFAAKKVGKSVRLYICGLGFYRLFINGEEITRGKLAPYISNPDHAVYYDEYDITDRVSDGKNAVGIILGNGMQNSVGGIDWEFDKARWRGAPKVALTIESDGEKILETDESFRYADSPVVFDDLRLGEHYDAREEKTGWAETGFDDSLWQNCRFADTPKGEKRLNRLPPIRAIREIAPKEIKETDGGYIYDFGYNSAGVCRLKISGRAGQKICLTHGELTRGGKLYVEHLFPFKTYPELFQKDVYICSGKGEEIFEPWFTYHGFRYVFVEGIDKEQATKDLLTYVVLSSEMEELTGFSCSDETVDRLQEMTKNSTRSNFFHFPTDCPQREKNGWTGDIAVSAEHMLINYDCAEYLKEWLFCVRKAQRENGAIPCIVPTAEWGYGWGSGPAWDCALIYLPYEIYKYTGDVQVLFDNAEAIDAYLGYLQTKIHGGFVEFGLGDWCEIDSFTPSTAVMVTDTLVSYDMCRKAEKIFSVTGDEDRRERAKVMADGIYGNFHRVMMTEKGLCRCETQTCYAMLLAFGMVEDKYAQGAADRLAEIIERNGGKMKVGILGARYLFSALSERGYAGLAYKMIVRKTFPGYGEWVKKGCTSLLEKFYETEDGSFETVNGYRVDSLNHHFFGDISRWFTENVVGIRVNEDLTDCEKVTVYPCKIKEITFAEGFRKSRGGKVSVKWKRDGDKIYLEASREGKAKIGYNFCGFDVVSEEKHGDAEKFVIAERE